jgi:glycosyltransferase involved in cell wall biosynthesis
LKVASQSLQKDVLLLYRKTKPQFYSIERVFENVWNHLEKEINIARVYAVSPNSSFAGIIRNFFYFRKFKAGVYHLTGEIYYVILLFPGSKSIITIHDCNYVNHPVAWKRKIIKKLWFDLPVKHAKFVTVISEKTRQEVIRLSGCNHDKVILIYNPVDSCFTYTPQTFNSDKPRILQVGTRWNKNLGRVISAIKNIPCSLCIIGRLSEQDRMLLKEAAVEYENIFDISNEELNHQYAIADMVVFVSLYEGFGLPILEAQSTGRVVITSNLAPMNEIYGSGAVLVDPLDIQAIREAVLQVIESPELRSGLIEKGFENIKRFNSSHIAGQYAALYNKVLKNS